MIYNRFLCFIILLSCSEEIKTLPYFNEPDFTPHFLNDKKEIQRKITHKIGNFNALSHLNEIISQKNIEGKVHVANFMFTSCTSICPIMTKNLKKVSDIYYNNKDFLMLSFSVTPWLDSVQSLKSFARSYNIDSNNWHFLTGNKSKIYELARKSYFAEKSLGFTKDSSEFLHSEHVILVDREMRIRGIYNSTLEFDIDQLIKDISHIL